MFSDSPWGLSFPQYHANPQHLPAQSAGLIGLDHDFLWLLFFSPLMFCSFILFVLIFLRSLLLMEEESVAPRPDGLFPSVFYISCTCCCSISCWPWGRGAERRSLRLLPFLQAIQRTLLKLTQKRVCVIGLVCSLHFLYLSVLAPLPVALWEELKGMFFLWVYSAKKQPEFGWLGSFLFGLVEFSLNSLV